MTGQKHSEVIHVTRQKNVGGHTYLLIKSTVFDWSEVFSCRGVNASR